ncbi:hypothetical protein DYY67_1313 [Candidatus Nitrosotalea sp. TS]|nr:hypothetical protein [Candidatus Nitrosotalea sp. TS]
MMLETRRSFLAIFVGVWELVFVLGIFPTISLPSPLMVAGSFAKIILNLSLPIGVGVTMGRLVAGFSISIVLGTLIGFTNDTIQGIWQDPEFLLGRTLGVSKHRMGPILHSIDRLQ